MMAKKADLYMRAAVASSLAWLTGVGGRGTAAVATDRVCTPRVVTVAVGGVSVDAVVATVVRARVAEAARVAAFSARNCSKAASR